MIRRGEEDFGFQGMGDVLMRGEFLSVVEGDGVDEVADRLEATHGCLLCCAGSRTRQLDDFGQLGFALDPQGASENAYFRSRSVPACSNLFI